jgi:hypothetical protein
VGPWRVAPPAGVGVVGRAEAGGRDVDGRAGGGLELEAGAAAAPLLEQRRAQRCRLRAVPRAVEVAVPTGAARRCRRGSWRARSATPRRCRDAPASARRNTTATSCGSFLLSILLHSAAV